MWGFQTRGDELTGLCSEFHRGFYCLLAPEALSCYRILHAKVHKQRIRITIYDTRGTVGSPSRRSIKLLNHIFGKHDLFSAIGSHRCRQVLEANLECAGTQLTIERVRRQFVGQLLGIQEGLLECIWLLFRLLPFRLSGGQEPRHNIWKRSFEILGVAAHAHAAFHLFGILSVIAILRSPDIKLNIRPGCPRRRILFVFLRTIIKSEKRPIQIIVFHPHQGVVGYILADDGAGIERGKVRNSYRGFEVEAGFGGQDNRPFIGILLGGFFASWLSRQHLHALPSLVAFPKDEGLNLDSLASREDVADGNGTRICHGHCIVEHVQLLIEFHCQVAILNTIGGYRGASCRSTLPMKFEDILWSNVIFHHGPFDDILRGHPKILYIFVRRLQNEGLFCPDTHYLEFFDYGIARLIQEDDIAPYNYIRRILCLYNPLGICSINTGTLATHKVLTYIVELVGRE